MLKFNKIYNEKLTKFEEEWVSPGKIIYTKISIDGDVVWTIVGGEDHYVIQYSGEGDIGEDEMKVGFNPSSPDSIRGSLKLAKRIITQSMRRYHDTDEVTLQSYE